MDMEPIKHEMKRYWSRRVEKFSALRCREFESEKHRQWMRELERHLPAGRSLDILDVGTGTGFFALLLAEKGHRVTGIDLTPGMIREAGRLSAELGLPARFLVMDAELPELPARSFDAIVTRKLTWTLPSLGRAYTNWHRLLKPGGGCSSRAVCWSILTRITAGRNRRRRCRRITRIRTSGQG